MEGGKVKEQCVVLRKRWAWRGRGSGGRTDGGSLSTYLVVSSQPSRTSRERGGREDRIQGYSVGGVEVIR